MQEEHSITDSTIDDSSVRLEGVADFARQLRESDSLFSLARRAGITQNGLNNIMEGKSDPKLSTILRLTHAIGCELRLVWEPKVFGLRQRLHDIECKIEDCEQILGEADTVCTTSAHAIEALRQERRNIERRIQRKEARNGGQS